MHRKAADDLRKGKYTTGWIYCWHCVAFGVAGWVTYLQKEKGAQVGGWAVAETEDDEEGATPAQSNVEGSGGQ